MQLSIPPEEHDAFGRWLELQLASMVPTEVVETLLAYIISYVKVSDSIETNELARDMVDFLEDDAPAFVEKVTRAVQSKVYVKKRCAESDSDTGFNPPKQPKRDREKSIPTGPSRGRAGVLAHNISRVIAGRGRGAPTLNANAPPFHPRLPYISKDSPGGKVKPDDATVLANIPCMTKLVLGHCTAAGCPYLHAGSVPSTPNISPHTSTNTARPRLNSQTRRHSEFAALGPTRDPNNTTLVVEKIPHESTNRQAVSAYFSHFGQVTNVELYRKSHVALVSFKDNSTAEKAYRSPEAAFGNRFVKIFWRKSDYQAPNEPAEVAPSEEDVKAKIAEAQAKYEEKRRKLTEKDELDKRVLELEQKRAELLTKLAKDGKTEAEATEDRNDAETTALLAQLAELEQKAAKYGIVEEHGESGTAPPTGSRYRGRNATWTPAHGTVYGTRGTSSPRGVWGSVRSRALAGRSRGRSRGPVAPGRGAKTVWFKNRASANDGEADSAEDTGVDQGPIIQDNEAAPIAQYAEAEAVEDLDLDVADDEDDRWMKR